MYTRETFSNVTPLTPASNEKKIIVELKNVQTIITVEKKFEELTFDLTRVKGADFASICENLSKKYYKGNVIKVIMNNKLYVFKPTHELKYCVSSNIRGEDDIKSFRYDIRDRINSYKGLVKLGQAKDYVSFTAWVHEVYNEQVTKEYFDYYNQVIATFRTNFAYTLSKHRNDTKYQWKSKNTNESDYICTEYVFNTKNYTDYYNIKSKIGTEKSLANLKNICENPNPLTEQELEELKKFAYVYGVVEHPCDIGKVMFTKTHRSTPHGYTEEIDFHEVAQPYYANYDKIKKEDLRESSKEARMFKIPFSEENSFKARHQYEVLQYLKSQGNKYLRAGYVICPLCGSVIKDTDTCTCLAESDNPITIVSEENLYNYGYEIDFEQYEERELLHIITEQPELINVIRKMFTSDDIKERPEVVLNYIKNEIGRC